MKPVTCPLLAIIVFLNFPPKSSSIDGRSPYAARPMFYPPNLKHVYHPRLIGPAPWPAYVTPPPFPPHTHKTPPAFPPHTHVTPVPYRHHPPHQCNVCSKSTSGFDYLVYKLMKIYEKVLMPCPPTPLPTGPPTTTPDPTTTPPPTPPCPEGPMTVYGDLTSAFFPLTSVATCPTGKEVIGCRCSNEDGTCLGVLVTDATCTAVKPLVTMTRVQAIAQCVDDSESRFMRFTENGVLEPSLTCPAGFEAAECWLLNTNADTALIQTNLDRATQTCSTVAPCAGLGTCVLTLLCEQM